MSRSFKKFDAKKIRKMKPSIEPLYDDISYKIDSMMKKRKRDKNKNKNFDEEEE